MPRKLTRREAQLVANARRQAVAEFKAETTFTIEVFRWNKTGSRMVVQQFNLAQLENFNVMEGKPPFCISLGGQWRAAVILKSAR